MMNLGTRDIILNYRIETLKKMDKFIRANMADEESILFWLQVAVPDEATEEDYEFIAKNEEDFNTACRVFAGLVVNNEEE